MLMGTYHLHPNDTIILGDTVVVKLAQKPDSCHACVVTSATNSADVKIVKSITNSLWIIVAIIVGGYVLTRLLSHIFNLISDVRKRKAVVEDAERKHKNELLSKKLDLLKDFCFDDKALKNRDSVEVNEYINALNNEPGIKQEDNKNKNKS